MSDREPGSLQQWAPRVTALAKAADAHWVLFLDADEFLLPATGRIEHCQSLDEADVLLIDRFNVPLSDHGVLFAEPPSPANYASIDLIVAPIADFHNHLLANPDAPWIRGVPLPKAMARPELLAGIAVGGHDVMPVQDSLPRRARPRDMLIAHLPFTSYRRFEMKCRNVLTAITANPDFFQGRMAWHWRRWLDQLQAGRLEEEFRRQVFSPATLANLRRERVVMNAAQWFASAAGEPMASRSWTRP